MLSDGRRSGPVAARALLVVAVWLVMLSGAALALAAAPQAPATATTPPPCKNLAGFGCATAFGFNTYTSPRTIAEQKELGGSVSRLFVDWSLVQPAANQWSWQHTDSEYAAMVAAGLHPVVVAFTAPCWARPSTDCSNPNFTGPPDRAYDGAWATFIRRLTARYPAAIGIEVWNEPNLDQYFLPRANPSRYTQLLHEAYVAVKTSNPAMPVVSGGLLLSPAVSGPGPVTGGYAAAQFLAAMYAAGAKASMNALGVHVYPSDYVDGVPARWDPGQLWRWLAQLNPVRAAAGAAAQPIWITEMGLSTATEPGWPGALTPGQQANELVRMVNLAVANRLVQVAIVHTLEDQATGYDDPDVRIDAGWGVFTSSGKPKPAGCALSRAWHGSLGC